jgi:hypothetical protein
MDLFDMSVKHTPQKCFNGERIAREIESNSGTGGAYSPEKIIFGLGLDD